MKRPHNLSVVSELLLRCYRFDWVNIEICVVLDESYDLGSWIWYAGIVIISSHRLEFHHLS